MSVVALTKTKHFNEILDSYDRIIGATSSFREAIQGCWYALVLIEQAETYSELTRNIAVVSAFGAKDRISVDKSKLLFLSSCVCVCVWEVARVEAL